MSVLSGVRVLDFGRYIAGPYCGAILAEYGAEVIRVEKRGGSEDRFVSPLGGDSEGALFTQMNRNKLSITVDPTSPEGREVVRRLVATADVVIANLPPSTLIAMGLDHDSLKTVRPDIILASSSAYGDEGPLREQVGFDGIAQAMSGAIYLTGDPGQPFRTPVAWVDFGTALHSALGIVLALMARGASGEGQVVRTSLLATALAFMSPTLIEQAVLECDREPNGNRSYGSAPTDIFRTSDGWVLTQVIGQPLFRRWAELMGESAWLEDPRFATDQLRGDNARQISARMSAWCAERTSAEALLDDPHIRQMGMIAEVSPSGAAASTPAFRIPALLSETPGTIERGPPRVGEHTDQILSALGYSAAELEALRQAKAI